ncbi:MAG: hypothetical protein LUE20_10180 [Oscillospiraceae bacterium]|nr:hypothetical protein [Oscillospiraceae bacterium]
MAKRLMCIVLSVLMIMTVLPTGVVADYNEQALTVDYINEVYGQLSSGYYWLEEDLVLTDYDIVIPLGEEVTIDLKGYSITGTGQDSVITVYGVFTLDDTDDFEGTGIITGGSGKCFYYGAAYMYICGGGVFVMGEVGAEIATASFTMNGGTITGNSACSDDFPTICYGGGVFVGDYADRWNDYR